MVLFSNNKIGAFGKNNHGQWCIPIECEDPLIPPERQNIITKLEILEIHQFELDNKNIIDIQTGSYCTMFLVDDIQSDPWNLQETKKIYLVGKKWMKGHSKSLDTYVPQLQSLQSLEDDPELKIKFIYWRYNK